MAQKIQAIFVDPPIAIARLGSSNVPQDAYRWVEAANPRTLSRTAIDPCWTLDVNSDGSVEPRLPDKIHLRDGDLIRPVAPFFELWALLGDDGSPPERWQETPLTPALLKKFRAGESRISFTIDAKNRKAARRRQNDDLVFGTFPPLVVSGNDHDMHTLFGVSPPHVKRPMIKSGHSIPLGAIQIMQSRPQSSAVGASWEHAVNVETIRFRFTPGRGRFYGTSKATKPLVPGNFAAIEETNAILDDKADWFNKPTKFVIDPADTYDYLTNDSTGPSLGVVDDTCEVRIDIALNLPGRRPLRTHANVFVGPPDFAPDRRPFLSLADELSDRAGNAASRDAVMNDADLEAWVCDLFERVYETVSQLNLDLLQRERSILLSDEELQPSPVPNDGINLPRNHAMTKRDALRRRDTPAGTAGRDDRLPLTEHAKTRHNALQSIEGLQDLLTTYPGRLESLVREPFAVHRKESAEGAGRSSMRMPPFMRNSNGFPMTLSVWQYALLMRWVRSQRPPDAQPTASADQGLKKMARLHRAAVLQRLGNQRDEP
jgi:hypothetical protein